MARATPAKMALDFVERIVDVRDEQSLIVEIQTVIEPFGFEWFVIARVPEPAVNAEPLFRIAAWPPGWYDRYTAARYYDIDPIARHARKTMDPFLWSEADWDPKSELAAREMMDDARAFGLCDGLVVPIMAANGEQEVVSLACNRASFSVEDRRALQLISIYARHRACEIAPRRPIATSARRYLQ